MNYLDKLTELTWQYGPKVLTAAALLVVGLWVIRRITQGLDNLLRHRKVDASLLPFFSSLVDIGLKVLLLLMVASTFGIETTSFIAIFSAIAFSVGLALQGSLGNFASGVLILLFRPYRVGDLISAAGQHGRVVEIQVFNTILLTSTGKKIIIPNGKMTEGPIENIAEEAEVQAEITLLLDADTSLDALRAAVEVVAARCPWTPPGRSPEIKLAGITRDDMKTQIACWTFGKHYEETMAYLYEELKTALAHEGIKLAKERRRENI